MATGFSFIRSKRGKNKLVSEGYIYKVDRVCVRSENKAILTLKKEILFILFLGKSLSVSVGECRRVSVVFFLKKMSVTCRVGQWSCLRVGCR